MLLFFVPFIKTAVTLILPSLPFDAPIIAALLGVTFSTQLARRVN